MPICQNNMSKLGIGSEGLPEESEQNADTNKEEALMC